MRSFKHLGVIEICLVTRKKKPVLFPVSENRNHWSKLKGRTGRDRRGGKGKREALGTKFSDQKVRVTPAEEDIILWSDTGPGVGAWDTGFILTPPGLWS